LKDISVFIIYYHELKAFYIKIIFYKIIIGKL